MCVFVFNAKLNVFFTYKMRISVPHYGFMDVPAISNFKENKVGHIKNGIRTFTKPKLLSKPYTQWVNSVYSSKQRY